MKKTRRVALLIFFDKRRRILIQDRRSISKVGEEWGWFGGEIEPGETPEQAVRREIKEELNYELKGIIHLTQHKYFLKVWDKYINVHVFIAPAPPMRELKQDEGDNMEFFTLENARKLKMVSDPDSYIPIDAIEEWFKYKGKEEKVFFKNSKGQKLAGVLCTPNQYASTIIICSGIGSTGKMRWSEQARWLASHNYRVLIFDWRGRSESKGDWEDFNLTAGLDDLRKACDFLNTDNIALIGESFGANVCLIFATKDKRAKAVATLYGAYDLEKWMGGRRFKEAKKYGATLSRSDKNRKYTLALFDDARSHKLLEQIPMIKVPILITHGDADEVSPVQLAKDVYKVANKPKKLIIYPGEPHNYTTKTAKKSFQDILTWFKKYLK